MASSRGLGTGTGSWHLVTSYPRAAQVARRVPSRPARPRRKKPTGVARTARIRWLATILYDYCRDCRFPGNIFSLPSCSVLFSFNLMFHDWETTPRALQASAGPELEAEGASLFLSFPGPSFPCFYVRLRRAVRCEVCRPRQHELRDGSRPAPHRVRSAALPPREYESTGARKPNARSEDPGA